jgi:hypothetical protein
MLGKIVLVYPHPKMPSDEATVGIVTRLHDATTVDVTMLPNVDAIRRGGLPTAKPYGPVRVAAAPVDMIAGYRGAFYCVPVFADVPAERPTPQPKPKAKSKD